MEEQKAQQDNRFLKGRHVAYMFYVFFWISGTGEFLLYINDLLRVQLKNDNVQGFDTNWDEVLVPMQKISMKIYLNLCTESCSTTQWH